MSTNVTVPQKKEKQKTREGEGKKEKGGKEKGKEGREEGKEWRGEKTARKRRGGTEGRK